MSVANLSGLYIERRIDEDAARQDAGLFADKGGQDACLFAGQVRLVGAVLAMLVALISLAAGITADASGAHAQGSWTPLAAFVPDTPVTVGSGPGVPWGRLLSVSCVGTSTCVAVGGYDDTPIPYYVPIQGRALIETLTNNKWTPTEPPLPSIIDADSDAELTSVSCPTAGFVSPLADIWMASMAIGSRWLKRSPMENGLLRNRTSPLGHTGNSCRCLVPPWVSA